MRKNQMKRTRLPSNPEKVEKIIQAILHEYHGKISNIDVVRSVHKKGLGTTPSAVGTVREALGYAMWRSAPSKPEPETIERPAALALAAAAAPDGARDSMWEDLVNHLDKMGVGELHYTRTDGKAKLTIHRVQVVEFE